MVFGIGEDEMFVPLFKGGYMSVIYYGPINNEKAERLLSIIKAEASEGKIDVCQCIEELSKRLCRIDSGRNIAVFFIVSMDEFDEIFSIKKLLRDVRLILIFPESSPEVISAGYKLYPRFVSYADGNLKEVGLVLRRMIKLVEDKIARQGMFL